ncbi:GNAT family N-acetyltransferase [Kitasatospora sp. McL0602]|uniref:GNAT family N-acetyltransferase n=1 Tax=Kitasatospora sp. McL0602 TaxID=3439530 RepID=UPI003F8CE921
MSTSQLSAVSSFLVEFARRQAAQVIEVPGGFAVSDEEFARSHEHNQLVIDGSVDPAELPGLAEETLGQLPYRRISVADDGLGLACAPVLAAAGYGQETVVVMTHTGPAPVAGRAEPVELAAVRPVLARQLRVWMPQAEPETVRQLVDRRAARLRGAEQVLFLAARDADGEVGSWADLYLDQGAGIAQIEDLVTADDRAGRGLARAVVTAGLARAAEAGCGLRFLLADAEGWPQHWYARLGFTTVGRMHVFTRW